ncbi:MAG TPA: hypothetical protein VFX37_10475 [Pseudolabrys sp.]|nr:hypothetical protein [Pseudolabrys sp.]
MMFKLAGDWRYEHDARLCSIGAAIIGGSALSAGASIIGSQSAAKAQEHAADEATNAQLSMFNTAKGELQPFIDTGKSLLPTLSSFINPGNASSPLATLLKLTTPGADMTSTLEQTPGFQFQEQYGQKAVQNALAARGLAGPGGALVKGAANYAEGLAGTTWQNVVNALQGAFTTGANTLQNAVNTGAGSAGTLTGAATQTGQQIGSNIIGAGNAAAGADVATGNAIGNIGSSIGSAAILNQLLSGNSGGLFKSS